MKRKITYRPSPAQIRFGRIFSGIFALVALGFVAIGVTQVLPGGGIFGLVWTGMAVCFFCIGIYGAVSKEGPYNRWNRGSLEIEEEGAGAESSEERLRKLQALYDQRLITAEEFEEKRKKILEEL